MQYKMNKVVLLDLWPKHLGSMSNLHYVLVPRMILTNFKTAVIEEIKQHFQSSCQEWCYFHLGRTQISLYCCISNYISFFLFFIPWVCARWCHWQFASIPIGPVPCCWVCARLPHTILQYPAWFSSLVSGNILARKNTHVYFCSIQ